MPVRQLLWGLHVPVIQRPSLLLYLLLRQQRLVPRFVTRGLGESMFLLCNLVWPISSGVIGDERDVLALGAAAELLVLVADKGEVP